MADHNQGLNDPINDGNGEQLEPIPNEVGEPEIEGEPEGELWAEEIPEMDIPEGM